MQSPNYQISNPGNYTNNYYCVYDLAPADANGILRFDCFFFQLEDSVGCWKDHFMVAKGKVAAMHCGANTPDTAFTNKLFVRFRTDSDVTDKGFFCTVMSKEAVADNGGLMCGSHRLGPGTYNLLSANYPDNYGINLYCKWQLFTIDPAATMDFSCSSFDMISWDNSCEWDWMKVNGVRHCNNNKPPPQQFKAGLTVEYSTPNLPHKTRKGFKCTVTVK